MSDALSFCGFLNNIGPPELVLVLAIVLLLFGPKKLPGLGKAIGTSIREFRESIKGLGSALEDDLKEQTPKPAAPEQRTVVASENDQPAESPIQPENKQA